MGAGKSFIIRGLLEEPRLPGRMVALTYPTKILMEAQVSALRHDLGKAGKDVAVWPEPDTAFRPGAINILNYSTDSLLRLVKRQGWNAVRGKRGDLLQKLFDEQDWFGKEKALVTTPDVLHLIASGKYGSSKRLEQHLGGGALFLFDEFHLYHNLKNFVPLLERILRQWNSRIVLLSATPVESEEIQDLYSQFSTASISFVPDSVGEPDSGDSRVFNYPLDMTIETFRTTNLEEWVPRLTDWLPRLPGPRAVILESVHRLQWLKRRLKPDLEAKGLRVAEWSGLAKEPLSLTDNLVVLGTSAIEVGVDLVFKSLVFEATFWPSSIQRLGRVGRHAPGTVILCSSRAFEPHLKDIVSWDRTEFEDRVMKAALRDPVNAVVAGEMFRGDSYPFCLIEAETGRPIYYDQSVFAMFDVEPGSVVAEWRVLDECEKREELRELRVSREVADDILLRDSIFPFWGIMRGALRLNYQRLEACTETADSLHIIADRTYVFEKPS